MSAQQWGVRLQFDHNFFLPLTFYVDLMSLGQIELLLNLKVLSSEMDQAESRLIRYAFLKGNVTAGFLKNPPVPHRVRAL